MGDLLCKKEGRRGCEQGTGRDRGFQGNAPTAGREGTGRAGSGGRSEGGAKSVVCELGMSNAQRLAIPGAPAAGQGGGSEGSARHPRCPPSWGPSGLTRACLLVVPSPPHSPITAQGAREATLGKICWAPLCGSFVGFAPCSWWVWRGIDGLPRVHGPSPRVLSGAGGGIQAFYLPAWCFLIARSGLSRAVGRAESCGEHLSLLLFFSLLIILADEEP